ncbi:hypothetical protein [Luteimonas sp. A501]
MLSPVLARTLAERRPWFNQRVVEARQRQPGFDLDALRGFIGHELDVLAVAVAAADPDRVGEAVQAGYDIGIELVGQGLLGPGTREPGLRRSWELLVPAFARLAATAPREVLAALGNAAVQLAAAPGVRMEQWIGDLARAAPRCADVEQMRLAGAVCAWRSGLVQLRDAALDAAGRLPADLASACLGLAGHAPVETELQRMRADRWYVPGAVQAPPRVLGGFAGFGGPFAEPPLVRADAAGFVVRAADRTHAVEADGFGAALAPAADARFDAAQLVPEPLRGRPGREFATALGVPEEDLLGLVQGQSIVVVSPWSHRVLVGPRPA